MSRRLVMTSLIVLVVLSGWLAFPYVVATAFVMDLSGSSSWVRRALPVRTHPVAIRQIQIPTRYGPIEARTYLPAAPSGRSVLVVPGIHAGGVDEPRLAAFSQRLASSGLIVVSAPLPDLRRYRITTVSTDMIEDAAMWMTSDQTLAPNARITLAGVSFAGGLALVAAGRPTLAGRLDSVIALGAHADLPRVMRYLCTGRLPDGTVRPPHDYGVAIILLAALPRLVPEDQLAPAREALLLFLDASSLESSDRAKAAAMSTQASEAAARLPEPARTLLMAANARDVNALGPALMPHIEALGGLAALSPDRSPVTRAPVFLLHGEADNVIPSTETPLLVEDLHARGNPQVRSLLTPLVSHADVQASGAADAWRLIRFWKDVLETPAPVVSAR